MAVPPTRHVTRRRVIIARHTSHSYTSCSTVCGKFVFKKSDQMSRYIALYAGTVQHDGSLA